MENGGITEFKLENGWLIVEMRINQKRHGYMIDAMKLKEILESKTIKYCR